MESPLSTSAERVKFSRASHLLNASSAIRSPPAPRHPKAVTPSYAVANSGLGLRSATPAQDGGQAVTALHIAHIQ